MNLPDSVIGTNNVQIGFEFDGINNSVSGFNGYYFWMIDDIELYETPDYSINLVQQIKSRYSITPLNQLVTNPMQLGLIYSNNGSKDLTGSFSNFLIYDSTSSYTYTSASATINSLDTITQFSNTSFAPTSKGTFDIETWVVSDSIVSDTIISEIVISDSVYAMDDNNVTGSSWKVGRYCGDQQVLNVYEFSSSEDLNSISVHIADYSVPGTPIVARIFEVDTSIQPYQFYFIDEVFDVITNQDIGNWKNLSFNNPVNTSWTSNGVIGAAIGGFSHPTDTFGVSTSGTSEPLFSFVQDNGCNIGNQGYGYWYWTQETQ